METFIRKVFVENFYRKVFSLLIALIVWVIVGSSITTTRIFQRVPVRIVNLPATKTVRGIMPDGFLDRKITVTLTGKKAVLDKMGANDLEVIVDAANKKIDWAVQISKKNLVSVNPDVELTNAVTQISHSELIIRFCRFITEKVPVYILPPVGSAPEGYQFLDVWPKKIYHSISGPEDDVRNLMEEGIELQFDLSSITKDELDSLREESLRDEVTFFVPDTWKKIRIPYLNNAAQLLQSSEAPDIRLDFLFEEKIPLNTLIPIWLFYPSKAIQEIPFKIKPNELIQERKGSLFFSEPLFAANVSHLFIDTVRNNLEIIVFPTSDTSVQFCWEPQFVAMEHIEALYVSRAIAADGDAKGKGASRAHIVQQKEYHRSRFHEYMHRLRLFRNKTVPLDLSITPSGEFLIVEGK